MPGVDFAVFAGMQTESACCFSTLVEDQAIEVVGQVAKGQFRLSAGEADGADEQVEPVLLMRKDMLNMRTDGGFGCIGALLTLRFRPLCEIVLPFVPMETMLAVFSGETLFWDSRYLACWNLSAMELGLIAPHALPNHREFASGSDAGLCHFPPLVNTNAPSLESADYSLDRVSNVWPPRKAIRARVRRYVGSRVFSKLKHLRPVASCYDKLARNFLSIVPLVSMRLWLRVYESTA